MNTPQFVVRRMRREDVGKVHALESETFSLPWSMQSFVDELEKNACARYLVAEQEGEIIAYAGSWMIFEEGHITNIAVKKEMQGMGVGFTITHALLQYAANLGVQYITLEVRRSNKAAQRLYQKLGFVELGTRKRYYEDNGEDAILMVCDHMPSIQKDFKEE